MAVYRLEESLTEIHEALVFPPVPWLAFDGRYGSLAWSGRIRVVRAWRRRPIATRFVTQVVTGDRRKNSYTTALELTTWRRTTSVRKGCPRNGFTTSIFGSTRTGTMHFARRPATAD